MSVLQLRRAFVALACAVTATAALGFAYPEAIETLVSPEHPASDPVYRSMGGDYPALAFDGTNYLAVWSGSATRVTPQGEVLDPGGIDLPGASAVAFDGTNYLVVWTSIGHLYGARVSPAGVVLDPSGFPIGSPGGQSEPVLAFGGTNYLVVWEDERSGCCDIYGARVSPEGVVLDPGGIPVSTAPVTQTKPAIAFDGANYLVVWQDLRSGYPDVYGARVTPEGTVLEQKGIEISTAPDLLRHRGQHDPAIAFDGANYFVAWKDSRPGRVVAGTRVTPAGSVLDPSGITISATGDGPDPPAVAYDGTNYLVVWQRRSIGAPIQGARVSTSGMVLDPAGFPVSRVRTLQERPALAFDGVNYFVAWADRHAYDSEYVFGARVAPDTTMLDPDGISVSTMNLENAQKAPALAFDGTNYFVAWEDLRRSGFETYGARMNEAGEALDGTGIPISRDGGFHEDLAVAFGGVNYLVAWHDDRVTSCCDVYAARVAPDGGVLDPTGIRVNSRFGAMNAAVAFDGTNYLVVWREDLDIYAARVTTGGTILDRDGILLATTTTYPTGLRVAFGGTRYFVVWQDYRAGCCDIYGARVDPDGAVLDPGGFPISRAPNSQTLPAVAFDGVNYLVAWHDKRATLNGDVYAARVSPNGLVLDPDGFLISAAAGAQTRPQVTFTGVNYFLVWQDSRASSSDIYGGRVTPSGMVIDTTGIPISISAQEELRPAVTRGPLGRVAVAYDCCALETDFEAPRRVMVRFVDQTQPTPNPPPLLPRFLAR